MVHRLPRVGGNVQLLMLAYVFKHYRLHAVTDGLVFSSHGYNYQSGSDDINAVSRAWFSDVYLPFRVRNQDITYYNDMFRTLVTDITKPV